jgi:hypothetical protein
MNRMNIKPELYKDNFNHSIYKNNYLDLFGLNNIQLELHWLRYGKQKGRVCDVDIAKKRIYIVSNISAGGTQKYVGDLIMNRGNVECVLIHNRQKLYSYIYNKRDYIMVQQLINTNISVSDLINIKMKYGCKMVITIHDYCWLNKNIYYTKKNFCPHRVYMYNIPIMKEVKDLFRVVDLVIHPTKFTYDEYSKRLNNKNFQIVPHIDYKCDMDRIYVPKITNVINIGVLHQRSECKGSQFVEYLMSSYRSFRGKIINYYVVDLTIPKYKESDFKSILNKYNIHGLLLLNKWGETWSYLLTKCLNSGLSILYNNIGAHRYRINQLENKFLAGDRDDMIDVNSLRGGYENMLGYLVEKGIDGKREWKDDDQIVKDDFYMELFSEK